MSAGEPKKCAYQESDGTYPASVLLPFACGRQRCLLLKSYADYILANNRLPQVASFVCSGYTGIRNKKS